MNKELRWDDLNVILAVAREGSLSGAGRRLGSSHATVFRRLGDIEARLGVRLFDRARTGYTPTLAGEEAAAAAGRIEAEVLDVGRRVAGRDLRPSGPVRVTTTDTLLVGCLAPILAGFRQAYPEISLEVAVSNQLFNLSKREADVAIRPGASPPETLVGRRIAVIAQAIYGRRDLLSRPGYDLRGVDWIGPDEAMGYRDLDRWMKAEALDSRCWFRLDTLMGVHAAVRAGTGVAVLPCYLGDADQELQRVGESIPDLATDLWLLTHADLRGTARIRAFLDFVADAVKALDFEGTAQ